MSLILCLFWHEEISVLTEIADEVRMEVLNRLGWKSLPSIEIQGQSLKEHVNCIISIYYVTLCSDNGILFC